MAATSRATGLSGSSSSPSCRARLDHVVAPAQLADEDAPLVADGRGIDVLVGGRIERDGLHVDSSLVRERCLSDEGQPRIRRHVGELVEEPGDLAQLREVVLCGAGVPELEREVRDHRAEVRVADSLSVAVDRPLHLAGSGGDCSERVGDRELAVVVRVNPYARVELLGHLGDGLLDLAGQRPAVRVAERQPVGAGTCGGSQDGQGIGAVRPVAVEEVLGVEHDLSPVLFEERDRVGDHRQVLVQ